jgi:hypothetical protein
MKFELDLTRTIVEPGNSVLWPCTYFIKRGVMASTRNPEPIRFRRAMELNKSHTPAKEDD